MEKSQELIKKIQKKDKISRYILIALLILNLIIVWAAVSYVLGRIDKFERTIDCKLLIIPEDRTKAKFIECSEINSQAFTEIINGKKKPSFKEVKDDEKSSSIVLPDDINPVNPIKVVTPKEPPKQTLRLEVNVPDRPEQIVPKRIYDTINGIDVWKYEGENYWRLVE